MFNMISWQGYWIFLAILLVGYYLVIYLLYFRSDFTIRLAGNRRQWAPVGQDGKVQGAAFPSTYEPDSSSEVDLQASGCADELAAYFQEASRSKAAKKELLVALTKLLTKYPALRSSSYVEALNNLMRSEAAHHCSVHLSSEEVVQVWSGS
jgi:hypothetical protein